MGRSRSRASVLAGCLTFALALAPSSVPARQNEPLDVDRVVSLLQQGVEPETLIAQLQKEGGSFDLTIEDVVRLHAAGAPSDLIRMMARGSPPPEIVEERRLAEVVEPSPDALTVKRVLRMYHKSVPQDEIVAEISRKGVREPPDLQELLELSAQGVPERIVRALAGGGPAGVTTATASSTSSTPLSTAEVIRRLEGKEAPTAIVSEIIRRGMQSAPSRDEVTALRRAGATDGIMTAINETAPQAPAAAEPAGKEKDQERPAEAATREIGLLPSARGEDRVLITSVPRGARVFVAHARTRVAEAFRHDYLAGRTPLSLSLPPGDYRIIVQKESGEFESNLVPAWRTLHDTAGTRTLLDNADLTFDPANCCLPGTLTGTVEVHSVPADLPKGIIGDLFDGLAPYLFDGESLQIMQVRDARIGSVMKVYEVRKNAGQSRLLAATFIRAEGDPLDQGHVTGLPAGTPFDPYVDAEAVEYLTRPGELAALATTLGVQPEHLTEAVSMLRRAGKAIIHQQIEGGLRLLTIALDDDGRLRVTDQAVRPLNPFAAPTPVKGGKRKAAAPPPPPPLPQLHREVVPGLGLPRLVIDNKSSKGLALLLSDGLFCFVPARTNREFIVDPGTLDARVVDGAQSPTAVGTMHFSYHARYSIAF